MIDRNGIISEMDAQFSRAVSPMIEISKTALVLPQAASWPWPSGYFHVETRSRLKKGIGFSVRPASCPSCRLKKTCSIVADWKRFRRDLQNAYSYPCMSWEAASSTAKTISKN